MDEILRQVTLILRGMWKHRWLGLMVAWIVAAIGVVAVFRIPDKYEASARIYVDTQSILKPLMSGLAIQPNLDQQIMILSRTLISRPNVEKLIRMADLDLNVKSKTGQDALIDQLMSGLTIKSTSRDNLYTLAYSDAQPERAKRVVQSLASIFVESSLGDKRKDTDVAKKFIDDQIQVYQKKRRTSSRNSNSRTWRRRLRTAGIISGASARSAPRSSAPSSNCARPRIRVTP